MQGLFFSAMLCMSLSILSLGFADSVANVAARQIPLGLMRSVSAFGDCDSIVNDTCPPPQSCAQKTCGGEERNPYVDCKSNCFTLAEFECSVLYPPNSQERTDCILEKTLECEYEDCANEPDENVRTCSGGPANDESRRFPDGIQVKVSDLEESSYESVGSANTNCTILIQCQAYCYDYNDWICTFHDDLAYWSDANYFQKVTDSVAGECENGE
jgi:hypothetical protein